MLDETVGHVQREALVPVQLGLEPAEEGGDGRGVAGRQVGLELRKLRRVLLLRAGGGARRRLGGEDRERQAEQRGAGRSARARRVTAPPPRRAGPG